MKKRFIILFSLISIACWAQPSFVWEHKDHSFGKILTTSKDLSISLYFCNLGKDTLYINRILPSGGIHITDSSKEGILFDETGFLEIQLDPSNLPLGKFNKNVYIYSNTETQCVTITGTVITAHELKRQQEPKVAKKKDLYSDPKIKEEKAPTIDIENQKEIPKKKKKKRSKRKKNRHKKDKRTAEDNNATKEAKLLDASNDADLNFDFEEEEEEGEK